MEMIHFNAVLLGIVDKPRIPWVPMLLNCQENFFEAILINLFSRYDSRGILSEQVFEPRAEQVKRPRA